MKSPPPGVSPYTMCAELKLCVELQLCTHPVTIVPVCRSWPVLG